VMAVPGVESQRGRADAADDVPVAPEVLVGVHDRRGGGAGALDIERSVAADPHWNRGGPLPGGRRGLPGSGGRGGPGPRVPLLPAGGDRAGKGRGPPEGA